MFANMLRKLHFLLLGSTAPRQQPKTLTDAAPKQDLWRQAA